MLPVLIVIAGIGIAALFAFRWFERYRYTEAWRKSEFRSLAFGFLVWFGGIFGHRVPPPPQTGIEFASGRDRADDGGSGRAPLADDAANKKE